MDYKRFISKGIKNTLDLTGEFGQKHFNATKRFMFSLIKHNSHNTKATQSTRMMLQSFQQFLKAKVNFRHWGRSMGLIKINKL
jgi:hypothetical protein